MKKVLVLFMVLTMLIVLPVFDVVYASDRDSGGHQVGGGAEGGGYEIGGGDGTETDRPVDFPCDFKVIGQIKTAKAIQNYKYFFTKLEGKGHINVRTVVVRNKDDTSISCMIYIFSDAPFRYEMKSSMYSGTSTPIIQTFDMSVKTIGNSGFYELMPFTFSGSDLLNYFVAGPNCLRFNSDEMSQLEIKDAVYASLTLDKDDYIIPSPDTGDDTGEGGGTGGGDGNGGGDNGSGDGDDIKPPDFDLDWSNIFTFVYSIIKAFFEFIVFCLNMFVEFATLLLEQVGQFSSLMGAVFTFLPEEFITMILTGITVIVLLGIVKR